MARRALYLLTALAACHHQPPHKPGEEYLKKVVFEGNHDLSDKSLLTGLALHRTLSRDRAPDPYLIATDADRLRGQYAREGYFEADVKTRIDRAQDAATVTYAIHEGPRAGTQVAITGLPADVTFTSVRRQLALHDGAPFDYDTYDAAKPNLLGVLQDAGYAHARLDAEVYGDIATHTANVVLAFEPGPKCKFGKITVQGVDGDLRDAIVNRLRFATGDVYSNAAITRSQRSIYALGRFSTVQVQPDKDQGDVVDMHVAVSEGAAHQVTLGGGFGMDPLSYEVRGRTGYQVSGFPTPLETLTFDFRPAYAYLRDGSGYEPRMRALVRLERQDLFATYAVGTAEVGYDYLAYEAYTLYGPRALLGYDMQLGTRRVKAHLGWKIHRYDFRDPSVLVDPALQMQLGIDRAELVGAYEQSIIADYRDHPIEPHWGVYAEMKITEGTRFAGGSYEYQQVSPELRGYASAGPVVFAARARYGAIYGDVAPTERYFAGGSVSNRGFSERELSPSVTGPVNGSTITVPYGGAGLIDSSVEARFPIATVKAMPLGGVVFLDGGDVTETPAELSLARLNYALGFGLRLHTLIGPARFDFGYRLNRTGPMDPEPNSHYAFHLSLGEAF